MNKKIIPLILASTLALTACKEGQLNDSATVVSKEDAIASVNGQYISKNSLEKLEKEVAQRSRGGQAFPKDKLIEELISRELLIQDAVAKQLDKTPDFADRIALVKKSVLSQAAIQNYMESNPVTDTELQAEYSKNIGKSGDEYKARHILVKTEEKANQIIKKLEGGSDFVELAKEESTGPSGPKGGDLGWFAAGQMVVPFSEAVIALEDNKFTTTPVKTQFGYHIILREGSRSQTPPPFDAVKEQLRPMLQRQKMQTYMEGLRGEAKVEIFKAETKVPTSTAVKTETSKAADGLVEKVKDAATEVEKLDAVIK